MINITFSDDKSQNNSGEIMDKENIKFSKKVSELSEKD